MSSHRTAPGPPGEDPACRVGGVTDAAAYVACIKARLVAHLRVVRWIIGRAEAQGEQGLWYAGAGKQTMAKTAFELTPEAWRAYQPAQRQATQRATARWQRAWDVARLAATLKYAHA